MSTNATSKQYKCITSGEGCAVQHDTLVFHEIGTRLRPNALRSVQMYPSQVFRDSTGHAIHTSFTLLLSQAPD